ncbi:hypothetical protein AGMMS50239_10170 [Bacteroidia bacterium]|nr:hypothetical protein AGMMS50239_10170 [Bacteroidia bacterium]
MHCNSKAKNMRTLSVSISDIEYSKFGISSERLSFTDFTDLISRELMRQNLNRCIALAEKYGLSSMTMEEITNEVKAVRQNAKSRH